VEHVEEDEDLETLHAKPEFPALLKRIEANLD